MTPNGPRATEKNQTVREARSALRLLWRSSVLPAMLILTFAIAIANVATAAQAVQADYTQLQNTKSEYARNGMDYRADLRKPAGVAESGQPGGVEQRSVANLARFDYDTLASAIVALSPARSINETLGYLGFILFPVLFFLSGLWISTAPRRARIEKAILVRAGLPRTIAARQVAILAAGVAIITLAVGTDLLARTIARAIVSSTVPIAGFRPLSVLPTQNLAGQCAAALLVLLFFGAAGIAVGAVAGSFAGPALLFLVWDLVVPILVAGDPRNWFLLLGHQVFRYSDTFQLAEPIPIPVPLAIGAAVGATAVLIGVGYLGIRIRNPRAT
jgi:hypothetical protein